MGRTVVHITGAAYTDSVASTGDGPMTGGLIEGDPYIVLPRLPLLPFELDGPSATVCEAFGRLRPPMWAALAPRPDRKLATQQFLAHVGFPGACEADVNACTPRVHSSTPGSDDPSTTAAADADAEDSCPPPFPRIPTASKELEFCFGRYEAPSRFAMGVDGHMPQGGSVPQGSRHLGAALSAEMAAERLGELFGDVPGGPLACHGRGCWPHFRRPVMSFKDVPLVCVINLARRPDRWERCREQVDHWFPGARTVRFEAVDAMSAGDPPGVLLHELGYMGIVRSVPCLGANERRGAELDTNGKVGCLLSHVAVWKDLLDGPYPCCLVLEDDALILGHAATEFREQMLIFRDRWDVILLGHIGLHTDAVEPVGLRKANCRFWGTQGYLCTRRFAEVMLATALPLEFQVDSYMGFKLEGAYPGDERPLRAFAFDPPIIHQYGSDTNCQFDSDPDCDCACLPAAFDASIPEDAVGERQDHAASSLWSEAWASSGRMSTAPHLWGEGEEVEAWWDGWLDLDRYSACPPASTPSEQTAAEGLASPHSRKEEEEAELEDERWQQGEGYEKEETDVKEVQAQHEYESSLLLVDTAAAAEPEINTYSAGVGSTCCDMKLWGDLEFAVTLSFPDFAAPLGARLDASADGASLRIASVELGGPVALWNSATACGSPQRIVRPGDMIVSVNSVAGDALRMIQEMQAQHILSLVIRRTSYSTQLPDMGATAASEAGSAAKEVCRKVMPIPSYADLKSPCAQTEDRWTTSLCGPALLDEIYRWHQEAVEDWRLGPDDGSFAYVPTMEVGAWANAPVVSCSVGGASECPPNGICLSSAANSGDHPDSADKDEDRNEEESSGWSQRFGPCGGSFWVQCGPRGALESEQ